jgi:hypothetical protein
VRSRAGALIALAAGLTVLLVALGFALFDSKPRLAGTNNVRDPLFVAVVPGGQTVCQSGEGVPANTDRLRVLVGTYGRPVPPMTMTAAGPGARITSRVAGGGPEGKISFPVPRTRHAVEGLTICLRNGGKQRIAIGGEAIEPVAMVGRGGTFGRMRFAWYRPGSENWFQLGGTVLHRFGYGNAPWFGGWLLGFVAVLLLGAGAVAVATALREPEEIDIAPAAELEAKELEA